MVNWGLVALLAGIVSLIMALEVGAGAEIVTVPLLLAGLGVGALASQLGAVTVSAVPDELSGEVGGLQNTATNLGASLGTALAGSILIGALTASFIAGHPDTTRTCPKEVASSARWSSPAASRSSRTRTSRRRSTTPEPRPSVADEIVDDQRGRTHRRPADEPGGAGGADGAGALLHPVAANGAGRHQGEGGHMTDDESSRVTEQLAVFRVRREQVERSLLPLATSVDGRSFTFQASLHDLELRLGGYVVLEAQAGPQLGQITEIRMDSDVVSAQGFEERGSSVRIRRAIGAGLVLELTARRSTTPPSGQRRPDEVSAPGGRPADPSGQS